MGRAKQQFELGGGQWNPQVRRMIGQQDSMGGMIGGPPPGRPGGPGMHTNWPTPGGDIFEAKPGMGGGPGWGFGGGQGDPNRPVQAVMPEGWDQPGSPNYRPPQPSWEERLGGGMGAFPNMPPRFGGGSPAGGWGRGNMYAPSVPGGWGNPMFGGVARGMPGGMGGRPQAGPPIQRKVLY
jgi:hypothetical protein